MKNIIKSNIKQLRDPFVLAENGKYYMYGTLPAGEDWDGTGWGCYISDGDLTKWKKCEKQVVINPENCVKNRWAPEVHKYKGKYYMFTTYYSSLTERRGCTILKSDSPEGPFVEITNGHITPPEWDAIDGTFYLDEDNLPWMIFVHEWTSTDDNVGRMSVARLSEDLTHFISGPVDIFRADEPEWAANGVTDGCFMYKTADNRLLMIWSNFDKDGYCVAIAKSDNGKPDGKWSHNKELLFSRSISGDMDGGHGMIFTAFDGQKYLSVHSPNNPEGDNLESPIFIPLEEENGDLVIKK